MIMCSVEKLNEAYEYLRNSGVIHTKKDLAESMSANRVNISKAFAGDKKYLTESFLKRLNSTFGNIFNEQWLLGESDNMLKDALITENEVIPKIIEFENFPFVSQKAYAGYLSGYADAEYVETLPTVAFPVDHTPQGNYLVFEVKGDSMNDGSYDSYLDGDLVLCREIQIDLWKDSKLHFDKWDFVIVHEDGIIIKRIIDHDVENRTITIHSLNPDKKTYPDKEINLCEVRQILNVVNMMRPRKR